MGILYSEDGNNTSSTKVATTAKTPWVPISQTDPGYMQPVVGGVIVLPPPEPEQPTYKQGDSVTGGAMDAGSASQWVAAGVPQGSQVTVSPDKTIVTTPTGDTKTYVPPTQAEVKEIQNEVDNANAAIIELNANSDVTQEQADVVNARAEAAYQKASMANILSGIQETVKQGSTIVAKVPSRTPAQTASMVADTAADMLIPAYYTVRHWNKMNNWERALSIGMDALSIMPVFSAAGLGAREAAALTRGGRATAALRGVKTTVTIGKITKTTRVGGALPELGRQVLWPIGMAQSIYGLGKPAIIVGKDSSKLVSGLRAVPQNSRIAAKAIKQTTFEMMSGVENIVRGTKLPETVVVNTMHSAKIPLKVAGESTEGIRDAMMIARKGGVNSVTIKSGEQLFELYTVPLMKKTGGLAHGATDIGAFDVGLVIKEIPTKPPIEQGLFVAPNPIGRYALGQAAQAGTDAALKSGIFIMSKEYAEAFARSSNKMYRGWELESVIDVGRMMEKPAQKLFTRIGGERVEIYLATKLSKLDILKLKAAGLVESVKNLYTPTLRIKNAKNLTNEELKVLEGVVGRTDRYAARNINKLRNAARLNPDRSLISILRAKQGGRAYMVNVRTKVNARTGRVDTTRAIQRIRGTRTESVDDVIADRIAKRNDRTDYTEVRVDGTRGERTTPPRTDEARAPRADTPRDDIPRAPRADTPRDGAPRIARVESPRAESPRAPRVSTPRVGAPRMPRTGTSKQRPILRPSLPKISKEDLKKAREQGAMGYQQAELIIRGKKEPVIRLWIRGKEEPILHVGRLKGIKIIMAKTGKGEPQRTLTQIGRGLERERFMNLGPFRVTIPKNRKGKLEYRRITKANRPMTSKVR